MNNTNELLATKMLERCLQVKALLKGLHVDFLKSDHGHVGDELDAIIDDAAFELETVSVAYRLLLNAKPHHIAVYANAAIALDADGGNDRSDLIAAAAKGLNQPTNGMQLHG
jgi:hypothetical protein